MSKKMNILTVSLFYPGLDMPGGNGSNGGDDNNSNREPDCIENSKPANSYDYRYESMYQFDIETQVMVR